MVGRVLIENKFYFNTELSNSVQSFIVQIPLYIYTVVSHKYVPTFATLVLVQNVEGTHKWDAMFSLVITPSLPVIHDLIVGGGWARSGEMLPRLVVGWRPSVLRDKKAGRFCEVSGMSIVDVGGPCSW